MGAFAHCAGKISRRRVISTIANNYRRRTNGTLSDVLFCPAHLGLPFLAIVSHNLVSPLLPDSDRIIVRGVAIMIMRTRA